MFFKETIVLIYTIYVAFAASLDAPCKFEDPELDTCLKNFVEKILPTFATEGFPEYNIPPADPLIIASLSYNMDSLIVKGPVSVNNVSVEGIAKAQITKFKSNRKYLPKVLLDVEAFIPQLFIKGHYIGDTTFSGMSLYGDGQFTLELKDLTTTLKLGTNLIKKGDNHYLKLFRVAIKPMPVELKITATNLTPDNPKKGEEGLAMINKHWAKFYNDFYPYIETLVNSYGTTLLGPFYEQIPLSLD